MSRLSHMAAPLFAMASIAWFVAAVVSSEGAFLSAMVGVIFAGLAVVYWKMAKRKEGEE